MMNETLAHTSMAVWCLFFGYQVGSTMARLTEAEKKLRPRMLASVLVMAGAAGILSFSMPSPAARLICVVCIGIGLPLAFALQIWRLVRRGAPRAYIDHLRKVGGLGSAAATMVAMVGFSFIH